MPLTSLLLPLLQHRRVWLPIMLGSCLVNAHAQAPAPSSAERPIAPVHVAATATPGNTPAAGDYAIRPDASRWAEEIARRHDLELDWVLEQLAQARYQPRVAQLILPAPAGTAKNWKAYRSRFIDATRIRDGARWWDQNQRWLAQAETRWGVPASIITAIVGVETVYGRMQGTFRVLDALSTLAFDFPAGRTDRSPFFREELSSFFLWCWRQQRDPASVRGSYAGAIGMPQFMPSNLLNLAVDFNGDGHIDLQNQSADVVGSVANYLAFHGWQPGLATHFPALPPSEPKAMELALANDIVPTFSAAQMRGMGVTLDASGLNHPGPMTLIALQNGEEPPLYLATTQNFYTITRYNWSAYYAMAVIELAREITEARQQAAPTGRTRATR